MSEQLNYFDNFFSSFFVDTILISDCLEKAFSSDQIGHLFSDKDNAKYGSSFVCGDSFLASIRNDSYLPFGIIFIISVNNLNKCKNLDKSIDEYLIIFSFLASNSSKTKSGVINMQSCLRNSFIIDFLIESSLKSENNIFASTISSSGISLILYQIFKPCLFATLFLISSESFFICFSVKVDLDVIELAIENFKSRIISFKALSKVGFKVLANSSGISNLITISSMVNGYNNNYINFSLGLSEQYIGGKN